MENTSPLPFSGWIISDLEKSGLTPKGFPLPVIETDNGYKIQYPDPVNGGCMKDLRGRDYCRERLLVPVRDKNGKLIKYLTLTGSGNRIFILPDVHLHLIDNPVAEMLVTEGEKKVAKGNKAGLRCVGLGGIWNWLESKEKRQEKGEKYKIHADLFPYLTEGRNVILIFDSDATEKEKALDFDYCAFRFAESLDKLGCKLYRVNIPGGGFNVKAGLDDYLLAHSADDLKAHILAAKTLVDPRDNPRAWYKNPELSELVKREGWPAIASKSSIILNQCFFTGLFDLQHEALYESNEERFYMYKDDSGQWKYSSVHTIKNHLSNDFSAFFREIEPDDHDKYLVRRSNSHLDSVVGLLKGKIERTGIFVRDVSKPFIHCLNGILDLSDTGNIQLKTFSPDWYSRNMLPIAFDESATCPRFIDELLKVQLLDEDIDLLQKWGGSVILGGNPAQVSMITCGTPGGGKGTLSETMEQMSGLENTAQLRTAHLNERFEIRNFVGKSLLLGKDVPGDFLMTRGAEVIKCLCGHDYLDAEMKNQNDTTKVRGDFGILINCNSRLRVRLDGDTDAWRRRLLIIPYERPPVAKPIPNFSRMLFESEGAGILNFFIRGAVRIVHELKEYGRIQKTDRQQRRIDGLLEESNSALHFVQNCLVTGDYDITTEELNESYVKHCGVMGWQPLLF